MIAPLQSLKGIFALLIVMSHIKCGDGYLFSVGGEVGVSFFFMASGFFMWMHHRDAGSGYRAFMLTRFRKLYPLHWACLVLYLIAVPWFRMDLTGAASAALNVALLQSWVPKPEFFFSLNAVTWFLSDLMLCYALVPLLAALLSRRGARLKAGVGAIITLYMSGCALFPVENDNYWIYIFPPMRVADFFMGMVAARLMEAYGRNRVFRSPALSLSLEFMALILSAAAIWAWPGMDSRWGVSLLWWIPFGLLLISFGADRRSPLSRILSLRPLVWLGDISLGVYMIQLAVIKGSERWITIPAPGDAAYAVYAILTIVAVIVAGWLTQRLNKLLSKISK